VEETGSGSCPLVSYDISGKQQNFAGLESFEELKF
jgi:hypothetical protein